MGLRFAPHALRSALLCLAAAALWSCAECEKDFDCPGTKVCNTSAGQCEDFVCREDRDCPPTKGCRGNRCKATEAPPTDEDADAFLLGAAASAPGSTPQDALVFSPPD